MGLEPTVYFLFTLIFSPHVRFLSCSCVVPFLSPMQDVPLDADEDEEAEEDEEVTQASKKKRTE